MKQVFHILCFGFSIFVFFTLASGVVSATDYYISPTGNDANSGLSIISPLGTFVKAWSLVKPGDTLLLMDGVYKQSLNPTINGAPGKYITVKAQNDGGAIIDGEFQRIPVQIGQVGPGSTVGNYFSIEGLVAKNSSGQVYFVYAKNVALKRNSGYNANIADNAHVFTVWAEGDANNPANILLEDNVAAGSGRKMFLAFQTYNNVILRRNFAAWQTWIGDAWCGSPWLQTDGVEVYPIRGGSQPNNPSSGNNSIMENNINFGLTANNGISFSPNTGDRYANFVLGNLALGSGMRWNNVTKNFEAKSFDGSPIFTSANGCSGKPQVGADCVFNKIAIPNSCIALQSSCQPCENTSRGGLVVGPFESPNMVGNTFENNFAAMNGGPGLYAGPFNPISANNIFKNSTFIQNGLGVPTPSYAGWQAPNYDTATFDVNQFQVLSNLKIGKLWNSSNFNLQPAVNPYPGVGANLSLRYVNGQQTGQSLWPWPMEERIKKEFADPSLFAADGVAGRVWTNFSVTTEVCEKILKQNGAIASSYDCFAGGTTPTPTPTPGPIGDGDADGVGGVNALDLMAVLSGYLKSVSQLLNQYGVDQKINAWDFAVVLKRLP